MISFLFVVLALMFGLGAWREFRVLGTPQGGTGKFLLSGGFCLLLLYFGITSYLRARRISRSAPSSHS